MNIATNVLQREHVTLAFGTPLSIYLWPNSETLNAELASLVLQKEKEDRGVTRSNVGGWHSQPNLFQWDSDCVRNLKDRVTSCTLSLTGIVLGGGPRRVNLQMECWANVSRHGHYHGVHDHPGTTWSGVYYVTAGKVDTNDPANGPANGRLELIDPRVGVGLFGSEEGLLGGRYLVEPVPGLMVMFPSWLRHMVHPFFGSEERISISFNVRVQFEPHAAPGLPA
ncbi:MAG TPA: TIGR02466 family protein [Xanthobacteraceae bacterium]|jgi:uncharacterized protein (TIGR02466 family)|nr:TIGR02466 family protein [Xanthobacteraceae bacterium]